MRNLLEIAVLVVLVAGAACGSGDRAQEKPVRAQCDVHSGPCRIIVGGRTVTMDINPKPVTVMEDLDFVVTVSGKELKKPPYIELNMLAMDMGPNRVELEETGDGLYTGRGVIVKCSSGKKRWKALVTVPGVGAAEFYFDVRY
jgi:hypothetical protein